MYVVPSDISGLYVGDVQLLKEGETESDALAPGVPVGTILDVACTLIKHRRMSST